MSDQNGESGWKSVTVEKDPREDVERVVDGLPSLRTYIESRGVHTAEPVKKGGGEVRYSHPVHGSSHEGGNFDVNTKEDTWYCHRCDTGGDILSWIAVDHGLVECNRADDIGHVFPEVLRTGASEAGIPLEIDGMSPDEIAEWRTERDMLDRIYNDASKYYHMMADTVIKHTNGSEGTIRELVSRTYGLSDETIDSNRVGWAPPTGTKLIDHLREKGYADEDILASGVAVRTSDGLKDFFQGRIMFWYREAGKYRFAIGRQTKMTPDKEWERSKYKKIPRHSDTREYISTLVKEPVFGRDTVGSDETVIVAEGITDCMVLHEMGFSAVSPVTTHFRGDVVIEVAKALRNKDVVVVMDEDSNSEAGLDGAVKTARELTEAPGAGPKSVAVGRLPTDDGEDVDVASWYASGATAGDMWDVIRHATPAGVAAFKWGDAPASVLYRHALDHLHRDPSAVMVTKEDDGGDTIEVRHSVEDMLGDERDLASAHHKFEAKLSFGKPLIDGKTRVSMYEIIMWEGLDALGEVFQTDTGDVYYFLEETGRIYTVESSRRAVFSREFMNLIRERFGISADEWGRTIFTNIYNRMAEAKVVEAHKFAAYDETDHVLRISNFDGGYYRLDGESIEKRRNGDEMFFLPVEGSESYEYVPEGERSEPDSEPVVGERPVWLGRGDLIHRWITNRVNYSERAALSPAEQRAQLYLHLHTFPFGEIISSRPIMSWVGEKGSGKTVTQRAVTKFIFGEGAEETTMPAKEDGFISLVSNEPFAFVDNYDDGKAWANDMLAAVSTGAPIKTRELYTTASLKTIRPDCWLSLTSRTPPFRRDDVADRCLVFRVDRLESFVGTHEFIGAMLEVRDDLWSEYLDNLNAIISALKAGTMYAKESDHRMADWAKLAMTIADALDVEDTDDLLDNMAKERAVFALEDEPLAEAMRAVIAKGETDVTEWRTASEWAELLDAWAQAEAIPLDVATGRGIASKFTQYQSELKEVFGLEMKDNGRHANHYRLGGGDKGLGVW